jgi:predicted DNA-binding protein
MNIIDLIRIQCIQEDNMSKTVTLRIKEGSYEKIKDHAISENRTLSNFIETATLKYIDEVDMVDEFEMEEIASNADLLKRLKKASQDSRQKKGRFV